MAEKREQDSMYEQAIESLKKMQEEKRQAALEAAKKKGKSKKPKGKAEEEALESEFKIDILD
jgi:hypothetical protein